MLNYVCPCGNTTVGVIEHCTFRLFQDSLYAVLEHSLSCDVCGEQSPVETFLDITKIDESFYPYFEPWKHCDAFADGVEAYLNLVRTDLNIGVDRSFSWLRSGFIDGHEARIP